LHTVSQASERRHTGEDAIPTGRAPIPVAHPDLSGNEAKYLLQCVESGWVSSGGEFVDRFETSFAAFCGTREAISCSSGTAALHLALAALHVSDGDEVIVPTLTYVATANAVRYCGARPVFVDCNEDTLTLEVADVRRKITARTKAIVAVHLYGQCADMRSLLDLELADIAVIEDAAEAHGATHHGRRAGSLGTVGAFSFFGNKIVTTGEGGMLTLDDAELGRRIRYLRDQATDTDRHYWHTDVGFNYRITNLQAALGVAQMERIGALLESRAQIAQWYDDDLADLEDDLRRPTIHFGNGHVHWMYTVTLRPNVASSRDEIVRRLADEGIETRPAFPPVHQMRPYFEPGARFPVAERVSAASIALPAHSRLEREDIRRVTSRLRAHIRSCVSG
jgi:perosamine synthetase